ncbi:hypothetical protein NPIL_622311 [Nephila pilipes]|uniref:Uncharacterized protein n=1 Tax=Nephila pilipes TaxID=299642 RepID=A0A8X6UKX9_NEPPI|nr:hypothetical protein NPIL_622311 [Nephila pilipes]
MKDWSLQMIQWEASTTKSLIRSKFGLVMKFVFISMATSTNKIDAFRSQSTLISKSTVCHAHCVSLSGAQCQPEELSEPFLSNGTVTSESYCDMLANNFILVIQSVLEFDLMWFM